jgi:hypothetical protein
VIERLKANLRYAAGLRGFLSRTLTLEEARALIAQQFAAREKTFLTLLGRAVYARPDNPYRRLLEHAGIGFEQARSLVSELGLEAALSELYDRGVYVTLDEFKGRKPVERDGLRFDVRASDFDNPFLAAHYSGTTTGSSGVARRALVDLEFLAYDAAHLFAFLDANHVADYPVAVWRVAPPGSDGLRAVLRYARLGHMPDRWFSPSKPDWSAEGLRARTFMLVTAATSRLSGRPITAPRYVPRPNAITVARWLGRQRASGRPGLLVGNASPATRVCLAAKEEGIDLGGTAIVTGGEPLTPGKHEVMRDVGATPLPAYAMHEIGTVSFGCGEPHDIDDMHILADKVGLVVREKTIAGSRVQGLTYTSLLPSSPKLMLNTESGDYATVTNHRCGCALGELGFDTHISGVRSYEKLTSEGVSFMESSLFDLVERVLPGRFGGSPFDYQFVEEEENGLPRVNLLVAPAVGAVDEGAIVNTVLKALKDYPGGGRLMAGEWQQSDTLHVLRREPYLTAASKVLPLHVLRAPIASAAT